MNTVFTTGRFKDEGAAILYFNLFPSGHIQYDLTTGEFLEFDGIFLPIETTVSASNSESTSDKKQVAFAKFDFDFLPDQIPKYDSNMTESMFKRSITNSYYIYVNIFSNETDNFDLLKPIKITSIVNDDEQIYLNLRTTSFMFHAEKILINGD